jgi:hypothetical protein
MFKLAMALIRLDNGGTILPVTGAEDRGICGEGSDDGPEGLGLFLSLMGKRREGDSLLSLYLLKVSI